MRRRLCRKPDRVLLVSGKFPDRQSRGLVGHSMGGYGASRIGMKHADVFGSLYIMSPCCLTVRGTGPANAANDEALAAAVARMGTVSVEALEG